MTPESGGSKSDGRLRVLVISGGLSHERDISLRSGRRVAEALRTEGLDAEIRDADPDLLPALLSDPPDVVFPVLHGAAGEDGALAAVLDAADIAYVGSPPAAARLAFDKAHAKSILGRHGVSSPPAVTLRADVIKMLGSSRVLDLVVDQLGLPLVVKPSRGGSALGIGLVSARSELADALVHAYAYGDSVLVERRVVGTELAITVVDAPGGPRTLPPVEIHADGGWYDYAARYTPGQTQFYTPARLPADAAEAACSMALEVHQHLGLRDLSRTDIIVDDDGLPWFLEVNTAPGMTETSLLPQAATAAGLTLGGLCRAAVTSAVARREASHAVAG